MQKTTLILAAGLLGVCLVSSASAAAMALLAILRLRG